MMVNFRISSLLEIPTFLASPNIIVPKTTTEVLSPDLFRSSSTFLITVVFPTPGTPTTTNRCLGPTKKSRQFRHMCIHLFANKQIVIVYQNIDHQQNSNSATEYTQYIRNRGKKTYNYTTCDSHRRYILTQ